MRNFGVSSCVLAFELALDVNGNYYKLTRVIDFKEYDMKIYFALCSCATPFLYIHL